jgi:DNA-binding transcriptional MerR regulator
LTAHRRYTETALDWIILIRVLRKAGLGISEIRRYRHLRQKDDTTFPQRLLMIEAGSPP